MTDEEIMFVLKQADQHNTMIVDRTWLITFARLIAAKQREVDAVLCDLLWLKKNADGEECAEAIRSQK